MLEIQNHSETQFTQISDYNNNEILEELSGGLPVERELLEEAVRRLDFISPELTAILAEAITNPILALERIQSNYLQIIVDLLAHGKVSSSFQTIVSALSLDSAVLESIFNEETLNELPIKLTCLWDGNLNPLKTVIQNHNLSQTNRLIAFDALEMIVNQNAADKNEVLELIEDEVALAKNGADNDHILAMIEIGHELGFSSSLVEKIRTGYESGVFSIESPVLSKNEFEALLLKTNWHQNDKKFVNFDIFEEYTNFRRFEEIDDFDFSDAGLQQFVSDFRASAKKLEQNRKKAKNQKKARRKQRKGN